MVAATNLKWTTKRILIGKIYLYTVYLQVRTFTNRVDMHSYCAKNITALSMATIWHNTTTTIIHYS